MRPVTEIIDHDYKEIIDDSRVFMISVIRFEPYYFMLLVKRARDALSFFVHLS